MQTAEAQAFEQVALEVLEHHWSGPEQGVLDEIAKHARAGGWFEIGEADDLELLLAVSRATGAAACPLPVVDAYVATQVLLAAGAGQAFTAQAQQGVVVVAWGPIDERENRHCDPTPGLRYVLRIDPLTHRIALSPVVRMEITEGIASPSWVTVKVGDPEFESDIDADQLDELTLIWRLGLSSRALGAATRAHQLAVDHAKVRKQFGRVIGTFGAVQQRVASTEIEVRAARLMEGETATTRADGDAHWRIAALIAITYGLRTARAAQFAAHHTLGAIGYFEEHEAPWLFRRVHADAVRVDWLSRQLPGLTDRLVTDGGSLPPSRRSASAAALQSELDLLLVAAEGRSHYPAKEDDDPELLQALAANGLLGIGWPQEDGGRNANPDEEQVLQETIAYRRLPATGALYAVTMLSPAIRSFGTDEQRRRLLPMIARGELSFCLGYSEPESGSDLASLRTSAVRDGDDWVVNGQKIWTTSAQVADYIWLAVRTDPQATRPQGGITMFLTRMDAPGITVHEHRGLSGRSSCSVFFDDVRLPDADRVGDVNGGWKVIRSALAGERIAMGGIAAELHRQMDDILDVLRGGLSVGQAIRPVDLSRLDELLCLVHATRLLTGAALEPNSDAASTAAMAGVLGGEAAEAVGQGVLEILGPIAGLGDLPGVPGNGSFEYGLRSSIMYVVGGGTNDVLRGVIARGLGLPR